ncbi:hypothetical protein HAX54_029795 [Datura stramonium]|uniref:RING-type E3 ubiquitin transferase n=1 Tax=Datura stramonium TaxID=4076 RepID=A0ABS8V6V3_DATST|nr:hypothetical protein [Datura stramonium]
MWPQPTAMSHGPPLNKLIAGHRQKDRGSQIALKWAVDNLLARGQTIMLIHVKIKASASPFTQSGNRLNQDAGNDGQGLSELDPQLKELFLPFRVFCTHQAIVNIMSNSNRGTNSWCSSKGGLLRRFKIKDIPGNVLKGVPDFCTVYVISKSGKISSTRSAARLAPFIHPLRHQFMQQANVKSNSIEDSNPPPRGSISGIPKPVSDMPMSNLHSDTLNMKSPFTHRKGPNGKPYMRSSSQILTYTVQFWTQILGHHAIKLSFLSMEGERTSFSSTPYKLARKHSQHNKGDGTPALEAERTERRIEEARFAGSCISTCREGKKAKSRAALEHAEASQRLAELESQKRINAEMKALKEAEERNKILNKLSNSDLRYRRYSIEEIETATNYFSQSNKIGEGGYGPVYKCYMDHTCCS